MKKNLDRVLFPLIEEFNRKAHEALTEEVELQYSIATVIVSCTYLESLINGFLATYIDDSYKHIRKPRKTVDKFYKFPKIVSKHFNIDIDSPIKRKSHLYKKLYILFDMRNELVHYKSHFETVRVNGQAAKRAEIQNIHSEIEKYWYERHEKEWASVILLRERDTWLSRVFYPQTAKWAFDVSKETDRILKKLMNDIEYETFKEIKELQKKLRK